MFLHSRSNAASQYENEIVELSALGKTKAQSFKTARMQSYVGGMQAGAYVGIGIILIMTLGATMPAEFRPQVMGWAFGLASILVVIGGAERFTSYSMYTAVAVTDKQLSATHAISTNAQVFASNLLGSLILVSVYWLGEGVVTHSNSAEFVQSVAIKKMNLSTTALIARGALCNWLVCLALWMSLRTKSESAKCIVIAWCLIAFIAAGFEHSVANMTVHLLALFGPANDAISLTAAARNLTRVPVGNIIGGAVFVGLAN